MESPYTIKNILWHLLRGGIKSVPLAGELLYELLIGPLDDKAQGREWAELQKGLHKLQGQSKTLEEVALFVKEQVPLSQENAKKIENLISVVSAAHQGNENDHSFLPEVRQALQASVEHAPLSAYLADLAIDLGLWRGLGLDRPVLIEAIFVSASLSKGNGAMQQILSEDEVLHALLSKELPNRNLLIEGPAGSGKSTLLQYWALKLAERASRAISLPQDARKSVSDYIPIFLPLSFVELSCNTASDWNLSIPELVARRFLPLEDRLSQELRAYIVQAIKSGHAVILLDGADEISEQRRPEMKSWIDGVCCTASGSPIVLTSRPTHFVDGLGGFHKYSVRPFSPDHQQLFIVRWFESIYQPEKSDRMNRYLERPDKFLVSDQSVAGNPLFLTMMCIEFEVTGKLSRTPAELVDRFTKILLHNLDKQKGLAPSRFPLDLKRRVLESVASHFFEANRVKFFLEELLTCGQAVLANSRYSFEPEELLTEIESRSGLLLEDRYGDWQFSHLLFQEFFTARFRWRLHMEGHNQKEWLQKANYDERYENVMDFYSQLGERER